MSGATTTPAAATTFNISNQIVEATAATFNISNQTLETALQDLNRETFLTIVPTVLYCGLLILVGTIGNSLSIFVFVKRMRSSFLNDLFIVLSGVSLLSCVVCLPGEIYDMYNVYVYPSDTICKICRYINLIATCYLNTVLFELAIYRLKAAKSSAKITVRTRLMVHCLVFVIISLISIIAIPVYGIKKVELTVNINQDGGEVGAIVIGQDCTVSDDGVKTIWPTVYTTLMISGFVCLVMTTVVCYYRIWRLVVRSRMAVAAHDLTQISTKPLGAAIRQGATPKKEPAITKQYDNRRPNPDPPKSNLNIGHKYKPKKMSNTDNSCNPDIEEVIGCTEVPKMKTNAESNHYKEDKENFHTSITKAKEPILYKNLFGSCCANQTGLKTKSESCEPSKDEVESEVSRNLQLEDTMTVNKAERILGKRIENISHHPHQNMKERHKLKNDTQNSGNTEETEDRKCNWNIIDAGNSNDIENTKDIRSTKYYGNINNWDNAEDNASINVIKNKSSDERQTRQDNDQRGLDKGHSEHCPDSETRDSKVQTLSVTKLRYIDTKMTNNLNNVSFKKEDKFRAPDADIAPIFEASTSYNATTSNKPLGASNINTVFNEEYPPFTFAPNVTIEHSPTSSSTSSPSPSLPSSSSLSSSQSLSPSPSLSPFPSPIGTARKQPNIPTTNKNFTKSKAETTISRTALILTLVFICNYVPYFCIQVPMLLKPDFFYGMNNVLENIVRIAIRLYFVTPAINPILFWAANLDFRRKVQAMFTK